MKKKRNDNSGPTKILMEELLDLRHELRETVRAYSARLEIGLAKSLNKIRSYAEAEKLSRDRISEIRDLTIMLRKRKLKPEKGRRKDLRKIDSLITEVYEATHPITR
jgi:hypothetical protein